MGTTRTSLCTLTLGLMALFQAPALSAQSLPTQSLEDPFPVFATCAGRLSAVMEHQWLTDGPASDRTKGQREAMLALVDAVMPADGAAMALNLRIEAKAAHADLLRQAMFTGQGQRAQDRADLLLGQCIALIGQS